MSSPALDRILKQISQHRGELSTPSPAEEDLRNADPAPKEPPTEDVKDIFSDQNLQTRSEEIEKEASVRGLSPSTPPTETVTTESKRVEEDPYPTHTPIESLPPEVRNYIEQNKEEFRFNSIFDFRDFILQQQGHFDEYQKGALNSIVAAANAINSGCKCKRGEMLRKIEEYYINFVNQNKHTSLIPKIKEISNSKTLVFSSGDVIFLSV